MTNLACILVSRDRPDLVEKVIKEINEVETDTNLDIYLVEMGTEAPNIKDYPNVERIWYSDPNFRGKAFGHNVGLDYAMNVKRYDHFWIHMNDAMYLPQMQRLDWISLMCDFMTYNPDYGILSPTCSNETHYPGAERQRFSNMCRPVTTCDYLSFWMKGDMIYRPERLFLRPEFKWSWGAIHDLSFRMYMEGLKIGYVDRVSYRHLGGSTYGSTKNAVSRQEYVSKAKVFAREWMEKTYGPRWAYLMFEMAKSKAPDIEKDSYSWSRKAWAP